MYDICLLNQQKSRNYCMQICNIHVICMKVLEHFFYTNKLIFHAFCLSSLSSICHSFLKLLSAQFPLGHGCWVTGILAPILTGTDVNLIKRFPRST